jgi:glycosyltransferase involved in cell wall biosynthesis
MLSICIPTYNRRQFLQWTLDRTMTDFPKAKIVVSDNASTDGTSKLVFPGRFIRQQRNTGPFENFRTVLLAAHTKYCMYLGDDDYLLPDEVAKGVEFLETHPEVSVYYAPCQLYDEIEQKPAWDAFYVAEDTTFTRPDDLWNFIITKHVWPEHAIYRREGLEDIMQYRGAPYWCFPDLAYAFRKGPVHFAKTPYYRNITNHPVGMRSKLGDQQCLTDFGDYQAGLEILAFELFGPEMPNEAKQTVNTMIRQFIWCRLEVASRILTAQNRLAEAAVLQKRMFITGF